MFKKLKGRKIMSNKEIRRESIKLLFQDAYLRGKAGLEIDLDHITNIVEKM